MFWRSENQVSRILREYPWMWAIKSTWFRDVDKIEFEYLGNDFVVSKCDMRFRWWMVCEGEEDSLTRSYQEVVEVALNPEIFIGEAVLLTKCRNLANIRYLVFNELLDKDLCFPFHICRPPKGCSVLDMCNAAAGGAMRIRRAVKNNEVGMMG